MTVTVGSGTPLGTYPITVTATSGTNQQTVTVSLTVIAVTGEPFPASPQVYIDTTWNPPTGVATWNVNSSSTLQLVLNLAQPGDTVILNNSVSCSGNFTLPAKANPNHPWIYLESSGLSNLPPPGTSTRTAYGMRYKRARFALGPGYSFSLTSI